MKLLLIATTALVCVTSLATAGSLPERQDGSSHGGLNTNDEFLCNYGVTLSRYVSDNSGYYYNRWIRAATPVFGKGKRVGEITVEDSPTYSLHVAIYLSYRNRPRGRLTEGEYSAHQGCSRVSVEISPVMLNAGQKYWVVQSAVVSASGMNSFVWLYDKRRTHGALQQSGYSCNWSCAGRPSHHHFGAWKPLTGGVPYARVGQSAEVSEQSDPMRTRVDGSVSSAIVPTMRARDRAIPRYPP